LNSVFSVLRVLYLFFFLCCSSSVFWFLFRASRLLFFPPPARFPFPQTSLSFPKVLSLFFPLRSTQVFQLPSIFKSKCLCTLSHFYQIGSIFLDDSPTLLSPFDAYKGTPPSEKMFVFRFSGGLSRHVISRCQATILYKFRGFCSYFHLRTKWIFPLISRLSPSRDSRSSPISLDLLRLFSHLFNFPPPPGTPARAIFILGLTPRNKEAIGSWGDCYFFILLPFPCISLFSFLLECFGRRPCLAGAKSRRRST